MEPIYIALICVGAAVAVAALSALLYLANNLIGVTRYTVKSDKLALDRVRVVHISDLHAKRFGRGNCKLLKLVAAQSPDFIAVTGDLIHKYRRRDTEAAEEAVRALTAVAPVYFVSGNHEMRSKQYRQFKELIKKCGATVLDDCAVQAFGMYIAGVNCANIRRGGYFNLADGGGYKLLLAHLPQYVTRYAAAGYDCVLCGHAHGGQWRIPFTKVGIYSPGQGLFPKYNSGMHECGDMREIISRGLGNSECPQRLFNHPELVVVDFEKA